MEKRPKSPITIETELSRDLGLPSALAIGVGTMIAAGIFTLSGLAIRNVGSAALVSFLLAALVALFTALTYSEFASIYPYSGEGYRYARETFPRPIAYLVGWALFILPSLIGIAVWVMAQTVFLFTFQLIIKQRMSATEAIAASYNKIMENFGEFLLFSLVLWPRSSLSASTSISPVNRKLKLPYSNLNTTELLF